MNKSYNSLGLMSGTSGDGVDASVIQTDGKSQYNVLENQFFEYPDSTTAEIYNIKQEIIKPDDLLKNSKKIDLLSEKITNFHINAAKEIMKNFKIDLIGMHGQTIYHNPEKKISKQIGCGKSLSKFTNKTVIYNFRKNDLDNDGEGAPLAPIFHKLLVEHKKIKLPVTILNIGGISNITSLSDNLKMFSMDIGPGNCLIDKWIRLNSDKKYDHEGLIAKSGIINRAVLNNALDEFYNSEISKKKSYDTNDFNLSFAKGLTLENGAATLTEFTADICSKKLTNNAIYVCGGGRKNTFLIESIKKKTHSKIELIDTQDVDGDFIESQAFAYLAVRSYLELPISFPETTGCKKPCTGGVIVKNF